MLLFWPRVLGGAFLAEMGGARALPPHELFAWLAGFADHNSSYVVNAFFAICAASGEELARAGARFLCSRLNSETPAVLARNFSTYRVLFPRHEVRHRQRGESNPFAVPNRLLVDHLNHSVELSR